MDIYISIQDHLIGAEMPKRNPVRSEGKMIHIRISEKTHKKLRIRVAEEDTTIQDWVSGLILRAVDISKRNRRGKKTETH